MSPTKEQREAKQRTPIVGNAKTLIFNNSPQPSAPPIAAMDDELDTPF
jgi:hypothetical protein